MSAETLIPNQEEAEFYVVPLKIDGQDDGVLILKQTNPNELPEEDSAYFSKESAIKAIESELTTNFLLRNISIAATITNFCVAVDMVLGDLTHMVGREVDQFAVGMGAGTIMIVADIAAEGINRQIPEIKTKLQKVREYQKPS